VIPISFNLRIADGVEIRIFQSPPSFGFYPEAFDMEKYWPSHLEIHILPYGSLLATVRE